MPEEKIKISAVKYANTYPFIYGLTETGFDKKVILTTDHPADCASKLIAGTVDVGLVPVAVQPLMKEFHIITDFCLGAYGKVRTVLILSNCQFEKVRTIHLDYRSRSSVALAKILAKNAWKRDFNWEFTTEYFDFANIPENDAIVLIGDQCFEYEKFFRYRIDLAEEWYKLTGLPFVFACWTSNKKLDENFIAEFNEVLRFGLMNIDKVVAKYSGSGTIHGEVLKEYLTRNINFTLDDEKRKGLKLFLEMMSSL
jgi:chorismate dehydratase